MNGWRLTQQGCLLQENKRSDSSRIRRRPGPLRNCQSCPGHSNYFERRALLRASLLFVEDRSCRGIQEKPGRAMVRVEIEHPVQGACDSVRGTIANPAQLPVVLDEAKD